jgi:hypothetical protein
LTDCFTLFAMTFIYSSLKSVIGSQPYHNG